MSRINIRQYKARRIRVRRLALAMAFAATCLLQSVAGEEIRPVPPAYPDKIHVPNGCQLSTVRYLAQFNSDHPDERGEILSLRMPNTNRDHAVALVTWHGQLWCRDEYFGVFPLEWRAEPRPAVGELVKRTEALLRQQAARRIHRIGAPEAQIAWERMSARQRLAAVVQAARIIPFPTTLFWIRSGDREIPVVFFRPMGQHIAVYDPSNGTCLAECACCNDAKVVRQVATRLGYVVEGIHAG